MGKRVVPLLGKRVAPVAYKEKEGWRDDEGRWAAFVRECTSLIALHEQSYREKMTFANIDTVIC